MKKHDGDNIYRRYPAYSEGRNARADGIARSGNPYAGAQSRDGLRHAAAWWVGWDDEDEIRGKGG